MNLCSINDIKYLLSKYNFRFSKSMGQNFLIEEWVPERFATEASLQENNGVLEIGPGIGCLTQKLSTHVGKVVAVELDRRLLPLLEETLRNFDNVEIINADILKIDIQKLVREKFSSLTPVVCANLPYNITTPVLTALIQAGCFEKITVMIQKEVAKRICAAPSTSDYGAFTLFVNYYMKPQILFDVSPGCFLPRPKVTSTVITMERRLSPPVHVRNEKLLFKIIRAAFSQRRKILQNSLLSYLGNSITKEEVAKVIALCGFNPLVRGEELSLDDFATLTNAVEKYITRY